MMERIAETSPRVKARIAGVFYLIAGLSYQTFLSPPLATHLIPYILVPGGALGELSLILWLVVIGVNVQRWKDNPA